MGNLFRRFWMPAILCDELPGADCPPVRLRLLGENLVGFRDTDGNVGVLDALFPMYPKATPISTRSGSNRMPSSKKLASFGFTWDLRINSHPSTSSNGLTHQTVIALCKS